MTKSLNELTVKEKYNISKDIALYWCDVAFHCNIDPKYIKEDIGIDTTPIICSESLIDKLAVEYFLCSDFYYALINVGLRNFAFKYAHVLDMKFPTKYNNNVLDNIIGIPNTEKEFGGYLLPGLTTRHLISHIKYERPNALNTPIILLTAKLLGYNNNNNNKIPIDEIENIVLDPLMTIFIVDALSDNVSSLEFIKPSMITMDQIINSYKRVISSSTQDRVFGITDKSEFKEFLAQENTALASFLKQHFLITSETYKNMITDKYMGYDIVKNLTDDNLILLSFFHKYPYIKCISPVILPDEIVN